MRMPPAEGGRQVALWKVWDGGNTRPLHRSLAIFCFVLFSLGFGYFPLAGSSPASPLHRASRQIGGPTRRKRWSWSGEQDIPHHKILSFYFTMKKKKKKIVFFIKHFSRLFKKTKVSPFHPKKCCAIFLSLQNIPLTLHTNFFFCSSLPALSV